MWKALMVTKKKHPYIIHMKEKALQFYYCSFISNQGSKIVYNIVFVTRFNVINTKKWSSCVYHCIDILNSYQFTFLIIIITHKVIELRGISYLHG